MLQDKIVTLQCWFLEDVPLEKAYRRDGAIAAGTAVQFAFLLYGGRLFPQHAADRLQH